MVEVIGNEIETVVFVSEWLKGFETTSTASYNTMTGLVFNVNRSNIKENGHESNCLKGEYIEYEEQRIPVIHSPNGKYTVNSSSGWSILNLKEKILSFYVRELGYEKENAMEELIDFQLNADTVIIPTSNVGNDLSVQVDFDFSNLKFKAIVKGKSIIVEEIMYFSSIEEIVKVLEDEPIESIKTLGGILNFSEIAKDDKNTGLYKLLEQEILGFFKEEYDDVNKEIEDFRSNEALPIAYTTLGDFEELTVQVTMNVLEMKVLYEVSGAFVDEVFGMEFGSVDKAIEFFNSHDFSSMVYLPDCEGKLDYESLIEEENKKEQEKIVFSS